MSVSGNVSGSVSAMLPEVLARAEEVCRADPVLRGLLGDPARLVEVAVTSCEIAGRPVHFATDKQRDPIQRRHRGGAFFEPEELAMIARILPEGGCFVDVGANVGNHSLHAGLFAGAGRIVPVEPNPLAYRLLVLNMVMNGLHERVVVDHLGVGASDRDETGFAMTDRHKNLGASRMVAGAGAIATVRLDDRLRDESPDVIKVDVEGMEIAVLRGLEDTMARVRPVLLVEVDRENEAAFGAWRQKQGLRIDASVKHYAANCNYLCVPEEKPVAAR